MSVLEAIARDAFGSLPDRVQSVRGGDINQAGRIEIGSVRYFVKFKRAAPPRFFETEALGLKLLHSAGAIRVPQVIRYNDQPDGERPAYLILEWIDEAQPSHAFAAKFGHALAALHRHTAPTFGIDLDHLVDGLPQPEPQATSWPAYYRDRRIVPQVERARQLGRLPARREAALRKIIERMDELLAGLNSVPSLLHGDLWGGNYMCAVGDEPVLYDPHTYYGEREAEMAFTELFGGFAPDFYRAYQDAYPLDAGYEYRRPLHQLYHLLVHLNLFGEGYGASVDAVCRRYV
jgi:fructosamine-3-kinase